MSQPDPIAALAALNEAHDRLEKAKDAREAAWRAELDATNNANKLQRDFDALVRHLHENAPEGTDWYYEHGGS